MRRVTLAILVLFVTMASFAQQPTVADLDKTFPITLEIERSSVTNVAKDSPERLRQASAMGIAPPVFGAFFGTLNGENHWRLGCMGENTRYEVNPCIDMPIGLHRARWVHNRELLEVFAYDADGKVSLRYIDVTIDPKNPPPPADPVQQLPVNPGFFTMSQPGHAYPLLVHVYGAVALSFQIGELPAQTSCDITVSNPDRANVTCKNYPPVPINQGTVELQASVDGKLSSFSCDAKWRWSKCSVIGPGFYYARWKDNDQSTMILLERVS
jgi:hypothetical protein